MRKLEKMNKRMFELSFMNVLLCLLVVFIHVSSEAVINLQKQSFQFFAVSSFNRAIAFVVQGFIFLSALKLIKFSNNFSAKRFYLGRARTIVLPYMLWVVIYYIYFMRNGYFTFSLCDLAGYVLVGDLVSHFYFIVLIVQFYALAPLWLALSGRMNAFSLIALGGAASLAASFAPKFLSVISVDFPYTDRVFVTYMIYWMLGCAAGKDYDKFKSALMSHRGAVYFTFASLCVADVAFYQRTVTGGGVFVFAEQLHILYCTAAILAVFPLSCSVKEFDGKSGRIRAFFATLDMSTYNIYLSHCLVIFICNDYMNRFGIVSLAKRYALRCVFVYFITVSLCMAWQYAKKRRILDKSARM